jgi:uncharacterized RDD family membrane protein YckC
VRAAPEETWRPLVDVFAFARLTPPPLTDVAPGTPWTDRTPHPWRRYIARMFDIAVLGSMSWLMIGFIYGALDPDGALRFFESSTRFSVIAEALLAIPLSMIWAAIFLSLTGGTPGKWFAGVRILDANGNPPSLFAAFEREATVWIVGLGFGVPVVNLGTMLTAYTELDKHSRTWWDRRLNLVATHRPAGGLQTGLIAAAFAVWIATNIASRLMML